MKTALLAAALALGFAGAAQAETAKINGLDMYYEVHGEGEPIVLLHGAYMSIESNWAGLIPTLAKEHKVIAVELPDTEPDCDVTYTVTPQQALLYRLCGDRNPLHADPEFAKTAGFPAPILHGLCTYGIVLRELTDALLGGDATRVTSYAARFSGVVFPGETIRVRGWRDGARLVASATVAGGERDGSPALSDVVVGL